MYKYSAIFSHWIRVSYTKTITNKQKLERLQNKQIDTAFIVLSASKIRHFQANIYQNRAPTFIKIRTPTLSQIRTPTIAKFE